MGELARRLVVAAFGIPLAVLLLYLGGWPLAIALAALAAIGASELCELSLQTGVRPFTGLAAAIAAGIDVFTVGGRLIRTIDGIRGSTGPNQVHWDGRDQQGDKLANGVYLYRVHATSEAYRGDKAEAIGRAVIMR